MGSTLLPKRLGFLRIFIIAVFSYKKTGNQARRNAFFKKTVTSRCEI